MRFGAPIYGWNDPESWVRELERWGYRTAYAPVDPSSPADVVQAYVDAAAQADVTFAEVGAWVNVLDPDDERRKAAIEHCKAKLDLAERLGARCCVNIAGSRGEAWDGPHPDNYRPEALEMIVDTVREIIDAVQPRRTKYSIETMPWMIPDSAQNSLELVQAVDRERFGIHFDPVNLVTSPRTYFHSRALVREFVDVVGPHITAIHLKDIAIEGKLTVHMSEVRLGLGGFDLFGFLQEVQRLDADMPVLLEHLPSEEEYRLAHAHLEQVATKARAWEK
jgi:sugar phosphate isomerase/epimerase